MTELAEPHVELQPFLPKDLDIALPWFDDSETQRWLGNRDWLIRALRLREQKSGAWFRGAVETGRFSWLAVDDRGDEVGYIDCGTFDRWVTYGGEGPEGPIVLASIDRPAAAPGLVVDPQRRRRGFGRSMLKALVRKPELVDIAVFGAGVEPNNAASIRCLEAAGFRRENQRPDFEGMLYYLFRREKSHPVNR